MENTIVKTGQIVLNYTIRAWAAEAGYDVYDWVLETGEESDITFSTVKEAEDHLLGRF